MMELVDEGGDEVVGQVGRGWYVKGAVGFELLVYIYVK